MFTNEITRANAQDVLDYIHAYPERHNQEDFYFVKNVDDEGNLDEAIITDNLCNTTMCIAGTVLFQQEGMAGLKSIMDEDFGVINDDVVQRAGEYLGLNEQEALHLFYTMDNEQAVQMLKKIIVGESILDNDLVSV